MFAKKKHLIIFILFSLIIGCSGGGSDGGWIPGGESGDNTSGEATVGAEAVKSSVIENLRSGNVTKVQEYFTPSEANMEAFSGDIEQEHLTELAKWIESSELVGGDDNSKIYRYYYRPDTRENYMQMEMTKDSSGNWKITNW